jgi:uncharacterized protein
MLGWFLPKEAKYFEMFRKLSDLIVQASKELVVMTEDLSRIELHAKNIKDLEHQADTVTHDAVEALHTTFITPLDRDDIHRLITKMDDVMDYIDAATQRFHLYDIRTITPEVRELAEIILLSVEEIRHAVAGLEDMKNSQDIIARTKSIGKLENRADQVLRTGMAKLFRQEIGFKDLIKFKEIYELLESVTDRCKDVGTIIEAIVLDHA